MGLFGGSKKTYVSSVPYNLAGEEAERMNYLKTTIVGGVFSSTGASLGEVINGNYLAGPAMGMRSFARWSRSSGFNTAIGMNNGGLVSNASLNYGAIENQLALIKGGPVVLQTAEIGFADYTFWADQWMYENHYNLLSTPWKVDFDEPANQLVITLPGNMVHRVTPVGYDKTARYLYTSLTPTVGGSTGPRVYGSEIFLPPGAPFPSTSGWDLTNNNTSYPTSTLTTWTELEISYSDNRPDETEFHSTTRTEGYEAFTRTYERLVYKGVKPGTTSVWSQKEYMIQTQSGRIVNVELPPVYREDDIGNGVTKRVFTRVTRQDLEIVRSYRIDTQEVITKTWEPAEVYIYRQGSGNAVFDAMFTAEAAVGGFLPFIPLRIDNKFVSPANMPDIYNRSKKALKKAIKAKYDDLIDSIADNQSLNDIDYAYIVFGVALNVKDNDCKRYIYDFLKDNMLGGASSSDYLAWRNQWNQAKASFAAQKAWAAAQEQWGTPGYGDPEPFVIPYPAPKDSSVQVNSFNRNVMNYDITISWAGIDEVVGSGLLKPNAKRGDFWFDSFGTENFYQDVYVPAGESGEYLDTYLARSVDHVRLCWQETATSWRYLNIYGLTHENMIYGGKSVIITATAALADTVESGFIVPIHERIFKSLPLKVSTQVSTACCFVVFNCYTVVKQKWYQTGLFRIFLVVVIAIVSIWFPPAGGAAGGILGTSTVVGAALGFTGTAALIAGAIANAVAAMILSQLIMTVSSKLLGDKIGAIIGAIASFFAIQAGTAFSAGQSFTSIYQDLLRIDNLMKLTNAFGSGVTQYLHADAADYMRQGQEVLEQYKTQSGILTQAYEENFGLGGGVINPLGFTESSGSMFEPSDSFLQRTLMTGTDIAQMSNDMISNFSPITLNQNLS